jgi:hypothetical protein
MKSFLKRTICAQIMLCVLAIGAAWADANNGDFLGYTLGNNYTQPVGDAEELGANGMLRINAAKPVKPDDITEVRLIVTAESRTIGYITGASWFATEAEARDFAKRYINLLHAKYSNWLFGREQMDINMRIDEVNLDNQPYNIRFRLDERQHNGKNQWRFSMTLGWLPTSKEAEAWADMANTQRLSIISDDRKQILETSNMRGL